MKQRLSRIAEPLKQRLINLREDVATNEDIDCDLETFDKLVHVLRTTGTPISSKKSCFAQMFPYILYTDTLTLETFDGKFRIHVTLAEPFLRIGTE